MKVHNGMTTQIICLAAGLVFGGQVMADELPKRKPGLWEIDVRMPGMPNMGAIQQCIDATTDDLMEDQMDSECSVMDIKSSGNKVTIHSICKVDGSTATTDGVFEGSFSSSYNGTLKTRFNPPLEGMSETTMTQKARWLGPCKAGQKPGDIITPNMGNIDLNKMMNDPKIKEMMKQQ